MSIIRLHTKGNIFSLENEIEEAVMCTVYVSSGFGREGRYDFLGPLRSLSQAHVFSYASECKG